MRDVVRWFHLLAATIWIGGMITVAALVPVLRRHGVPRETIQAAARRFGQATWVAISISALTGVWQLANNGIAVRGNTALVIKLGLVGLSVGIAFVHQEIARDVSPAMRGLMESVLLLLGLAILAAAIAI